MLNLNSDKLIVVVKPEQQPVIYTGATTGLANVGGGAEVYKGLIGTTSQIRTIVGGTNIIISEVGDTIKIDGSVTGGTFQIIGSGDTVVTNTSGNTWVVYTPSGATGNFVTTAEFSGYTGTTAPLSFLPISGLTGYWNSGQTVGYINNQGFITGFTVTCDMVTGCTSGLYLPINGLNGYWTSGQTIDYVTGYTPTLDGYWNSGQTVSYVQSETSGFTTGYTFQGSGGTTVNVNNNKVTIYSITPSGTSVTWNDVTGKPDLWSTGETVSYINDQNFLTGFTVTVPMVTGITNGLYLPIDGLAGYWDSGQTVIYVSGQTSGLTSSWNTLTDKPSWLSGTTLSTFESGHTHSQYLTGYTVTANDVTGITASLYLSISGLSGYWTSAQTVSYVSGQTSGLTSSWNTLTDKPQWLSGTTLGQFETGHTHSQYISGSSYTFTGSGSTTVDETGHDIIIYTPIINLTPYALNSVLTGHTSDVSIHFKMSGITISESQVTNLITDLAGKTNTGTTAQLRSDFNNFTGDTQTQYNDTREVSGFINGNSIDVSYTHSGRTITLTGDLSYYWRGDKRTLVSPWTSTSHSGITGNWFLSTTDGTNFTWSQLIWNFYDMQVAFGVYSAVAANTFFVKETHNMMEWETHLNLHTNLGTTLKSGGQAIAGTYTENVGSNAAVSPSFAQAIVLDEDLQVTIPQWNDTGYTVMRVSGATSIYTLNNTVPFLAQAANQYMYINNPITGALTASQSNRWQNVYQILVPTTSDVSSQKYRMIWLLPQVQYTSLAAAQAEDTRGLRLGSLTTQSAEYVIHARISYNTNNDYSNYGRCAIPTGGITYVIGNKQSLISVANISASNHTNLGNLDWANSGHIASTLSTLASFDAAGVAEELPKATFSLSGHTHNYNTLNNLPDLSLYQPVSGMTIYLTGVTSAQITGITNGLYLPINGLAGYWTSAQTVNYVSGQTSGLTSSWVDITDKPQWLSGTTIGAFETGHTHSYNNLDDLPTLFTGNTFVASGACEISVVGDQVTIYAPSGVSEAVFSGYTGTTAPQTYMPIIASIKVVTGTTYSLLTTDSGKILQFTNTAATTITVPSGSTFVQGFQVTLVNYGNGTSSGIKTIAAGGGATVKSALSALKLSTIFGAATLYKTPTANTFIAFGDLSA